MKYNYKPLSRQEVRAAIEGSECPARVPMLLHFWVFLDTFGEKRAQAESILSKYNQDFVQVPFRIPDIYNAPEDDPNYKWACTDEPIENRTIGLDERIVLRDWEQWEQMKAQWPDADYNGMFPNVLDKDGRYRLGYWWYCLFERHWSLRGMTNALTDFYIYPEFVHELYEQLTQFYCKMIDRAGGEANCDGIFVSDDLGTQESTFFSLDIFREFFKPYYKRIIATAHKRNMHFWLHTCGNIEKFLPDLIDVGLDVIHPIQKHTMDHGKIAKKYGNNICIWAGFDVQHTIPSGSASEVRQEVRRILRTFSNPNGRLIFGAGNGINGDCPIESLEALFDEAYKSGKEVSRIAK